MTVPVSPAGPALPREGARCAAIRKEIVRLCATSQGGHLGGSMSMVEIVTVLLGSVMNMRETKAGRRDALILSKGHGALCLYAALAEFGFISKELLSTYGSEGGALLAHPHRGIPGIEAAAGSLGHGLAIGVGYALADRLDGSLRRTFVITGDGELQEGSIWESAMAAGSLSLSQLTVIIDRNDLQITGRTDDVIRLEPLANRWLSFGWQVREVDGHSHGQLIDALLDRGEPSRPTVVIAQTTKGRGVSAVEGQARSHFASLSPRQERQILIELEGGSGE